MIQADVVVIGGGPAGVAAATETARRGLETVLVEENAALGGKVLRQDAHGGEGGHDEHAELRARTRLFGGFAEVAPRVRVFTETEVWSVGPDRTVELWRRGGGGARGETVQARKLVVAVGARDRVVPFRGWQLPGVFTVGGLNNFTQRGVRPARSVVVAGTGPLQLALAYNLVGAGVKVAALVDATSRSEQAATAAGILRAGGWRKLLLATKYLLRLKAKGVPVYQRHVVKEALGAARVQGAVVVRIDASGRPVPGTERTIPAEAVAVSYGLVPQTDLTQLIGCRHRYDDAFGYWVAERDDDLQTSVDGVFVAGDGASIKGYDAAIDEGRLAGLSACAQLGAVDAAGRSEQKRLRASLRGARRIGAELTAVANVRPGTLEVVTDDTVVCRCEEVRYADIRAAVAAGARDVNDVKRRTRLGMGNCQGRFCTHFVNELMWRAKGESLDRTLFTPRLPLKPVPLGVIAGEPAGEA